ncbi:hypothetical protein [Nocardia sp. NPDC047654]|uniref:hypothetical protein n=1 Tax=Nocardia sp. NPDC047654 TaxID=3364314 RepID=UPI003716D349
MQRNQYGSLCIECNRGLASNRGFIYDPGGRNLVVCDDCIYSIYGVHKGFLAHLGDLRGHTR